ncbi:hypothetical protein CC78DRAFT_621400 [Lojkania enalia]|uniref:Uncharacterized protein n=1 Tax=Lojkania enalia TaxID=147567 RepID=A0A9P4K061_9PLEO|nr:hypothetical protein CC78DRAFT_621400 [Didymosphaeria enalia]
MLVASMLTTALASTLEQANNAEVTTANQIRCGVVFYKGSTTSFDLYKNDRCFDLVDVVNLINISNSECGLCVFWNNHDCAGDSSWWGGPGEHRIPSSMSFFCT